MKYEGGGGRVRYRMYCVRPQWQEPLYGRVVGPVGGAVVGVDAEAIASEYC